jgi:hypothetical protein
MRGSGRFNDNFDDPRGGSTASGSCADGVSHLAAVSLELVVDVLLAGGDVVTLGVVQTPQVVLLDVSNVQSPGIADFMETGAVGLAATGGELSAQGLGDCA